MDRKNFLQQVAIGTSGIIGIPVILSGQTNNQPKGDPLSPEKVKEFVIAGHGNLDKVKELLAESPTLLYATWDWVVAILKLQLRGLVM